MNPYTGTPEIDEFIEERIENLPPVLASAIKDDRLFDNLAAKLSQLSLLPETVDSLKHEMLLILLQLEPLEDLQSTLATKYELGPTETLRATEAIELLLKDYETYLTNIPELVLEEAEAGQQEAQTAVSVETTSSVILPDDKPTIEEQPVTAPQPSAPAMLVKKEGIIGARTMQGDIATLKKEEERKPFIATNTPAGNGDPVTGTPPAAAPKPPLTPPPLVRGTVPEAPANTPVPRYAKPITEMPRYTNLK